MEKVAFIFPGQGAQFIGMVRNLYDQYEIVRQTFEEANNVIGWDISKLCFEGSLAELCKTTNLHIALLTAYVSLYRACIQRISIIPDFYAGHSLGEYAALTCSGALEFSDCLKLVRRRGEIVEKYSINEKYSMSIVDGISPKKVEMICAANSDDENAVAISCYNSSLQSTISGNRINVESAEKSLLQAGAKITPLYMSPPLHCGIMKSSSYILSNELSKYQIHNPRKPVVFNVSALPCAVPNKIKDSLIQQLYKPVQWCKTVSYLIGVGITVFIEISPKNILCNLLKQDYANLHVFCFGQKDERENLFNFFSTGKPHLKSAKLFVNRCIVAAVSTPNKNENRLEYETGVIQPFQKLKELLDNPNEELSDIDVKKESLSCLDLLLRTKKVDFYERNVWFDSILADDLEAKSLKSIYCIP